MSIYGYVRVSSCDQNEDRQLFAMNELKVPKKNVYIDKQSGKDFDRPAYNRMLKRLRRDDLVYIKSIDRLGRNYNEVVEQWQYLTRIKGVDIVVIEMPLLDTRRGKDLLGTFLSDIVLQVLSFVAENERTNIRSRQREGIEAARRRGVHLGRPVKPLPDDFPDIYASWQSGEIPASRAAQMCGMSRATLYRKTEQMRQKTDKKGIAFTSF